LSFFAPTGIRKHNKTLFISDGVAAPRFSFLALLKRIDVSWRSRTTHSQARSLMVRVKVFNFKAYDPISDQFVVPICKRQLHDIKAPPINGVVLTDTVQLVDPNDLDKDGRYDPRISARV
jgi:hypothetical protein